MTEQCAVFITAPELNIKKLNHLILSLHDYEYDTDPEHQSWNLVTSVNPSLATADYPTHPPLPETLTNEFTGWSLKQIWEWFEENEEVLKEKGFAEGNCVVVDEEGLKGEEETVLYFERVYEDEEEEEEKERAEGGEKYKVMRCPARDAHTVNANLLIANMGFEDFVDEDKGPVDGIWQWVSLNGSTEASVQEEESADKEFKAAVEKGKKEGWLE